MSSILAALGAIAALAAPLAGHDTAGRCRPAEYAYVTNYGDATLSAYRVDGSTGALTEIDGSPYATEPNPNEIPGVRKVPYARPKATPNATHVAARELDTGMRRADAVWRTASNLKALGFTPDIIIGHHGWGEMLNLPDVWPDVPMLGYMEFYYHPHQADVGFDPEFPADPLDFPRIRAKNAINHIALNLGGAGHTPTNWQLSTYPDWARARIELLWEGVDLDTCKPDPAARRAPLKIGDMTIRPTDKLVTYVSRDLEPYRGFPLMMRTLPHLLRERKDVKVIMVGGDGISYGTPPRQGTHSLLDKSQISSLIVPTLSSVSRSVPRDRDHVARRRAASRTHSKI